MKHIALAVWPLFAFAVVHIAYGALFLFRRAPYRATIVQGDYMNVGGWMMLTLDGIGFVLMAISQWPIKS